MNHHPVRRSPRLAHLDYSSAGSYFVTICTQRMELRFGDVQEESIALNDAGRMVSQVWELNGGNHDAIALGMYVVMPNHLHGIVHVGTDPLVQPIPLDRFIGAFKSRVTVEYIKGVKDGRYPPFDRQLWQRSFHDRHLRMQSEIDVAEAYMEANPHRWETHRLADDR